MTPGTPQPPPQLNFELTTPQIGSEVFVCADISDDTRMLANRLTLPPVYARQLGVALLKAADSAEKQIVKPQSPIATA